MVRAPGGEPVAKMRIDYTSEADTGVFSQLATMGPLQGPGIATMLIGAGERRVHARGLAFAALGVEDNNPRARHLYQRLGYRAAGRQHASWETEDDTGILRVYENHAHDSAQETAMPDTLCGAPYGLVGPRGTHHGIKL